MSIYVRPINDISIVIVHCSDSDNPAHDNIETIRSWHIARGFDDIGYHYVIDQSGKLLIGRSIYRVGAHTSGFNSESIGICLCGKKKFSEEQFKRAAALIDNLYVALPNLKKKLGILPHRFFNAGKTCPNFEISNILKYCKIEKS